MSCEPVEANDPEMGNIALDGKWEVGLEFEEGGCDPGPLPSSVTSIWLTVRVLPLATDWMLPFLNPMPINNFDRSRLE